MSMISTQNTLDVLINSALKQKLNLVLGHSYLANIFEITDDGKVIIQIGDTKLLADSKVPLQPGDKIFVEVKESSNSMVLLQIINNLDSPETEKNQQNLLRNGIIDTLEKLKIPIKEENIGISQKLIKYNLSVSTENIHNVSNKLINAGYKNSLKDINILDKAVMLFSKGLPVTPQTIELVDFLAGNKGQVSDKISSIEESLNNILVTLENEDEISDATEQNSTKLLQVKSDIINMNNVTDKKTNAAIPNQHQETNAAADELVNIETKQNVAKVIDPKVNILEESIETKNNLDIKVVRDDLLAASKSSNLHDFEVDNSTKNITTNFNENNNRHVVENDLASTQKQITNNKQDVLNSVVVLKNIISDLMLKLDPSESSHNKQIDIIKNLANLVTDGSRDINDLILEKLGVKKEDIISMFSEGMIGEKDLSQNSNHQHNNIIRVLQEHNNLIGQTLNELNKHFDSIKLYNSSNNENNNFYMLPIPIQVAGEKYDNKLYFWSKGNQENKIDPNNMRVVFILNTQNLGLIKIDLTVVKRDVYAGIEVSNSEVKEELDKYSTRLKEQLAAIHYGLKRISCEIKKEEIIISHQENYLADKDLTTLDLRI